MKHFTREKFDQYCRSLAVANGIQTVSSKFNIAEPVERRMVSLMGDSSDFLKKINLLPVGEQKGAKLGLGVGKPIASRTNTQQRDRETVYAGDEEIDLYECVQTNFDTHINYKTLDVWGVSGDFMRYYSQHIHRQVARDLIMTGWNGTNAATETDRAANPLLEDVNIGWLERVRLRKPASMMGYDSSGAATADEFKVGEGGDYATLDALVFDLMANLLEPWFVGADDLVLIVGRELWAKHGLTLYNAATSATEKNQLAILLAKESIAGIPTYAVPFVPQRAVILTSFDNLSLYYQGGAMRRAIIDNPKRDRIEEFLSLNPAYTVEDFGKFAGVRDGAIKLKNATGAWV